jgi:hypothetical protein
MLSEPPDDLADRIVWRREAEETFADKVRRRLTQIVVGAYDAYLGTLTAAGDLSAFDSIPQQWSVYVLDELSDDLDEMYKAGALTAWNTAPTTTTLPTSAATGWAQIIAADAIDYQAQATNRLVGVGDDIWRKVNSQVTDALQKGASTEDLKKGIEQVTQFSEFRADTIARTEMNAAFVNGAYQGEVALGEYGPVYKEWLPVGDARMRPEHEAMMGQPPIPFAEDFIVGDEPMAHPLADGASASNVVNCRCDVLFYYPGDTLPDGTLVEAPATMSQAVEVDEVAAAEEIPAGFRPGPNGERDFASAFDASQGNPARSRAALDVLEGIGRLHGLPNDGLATTGIRFGGKADLKGGHFSPNSRGIRPRRTKTETTAEWNARVREYNSRQGSPEILINKYGTPGDEMFFLAHEVGHRVDWVGGSRLRTRQIWTENAEIRALMAKYRGDWLEHVDEINDPEVRAVASLGREVRAAESVKTYLRRASLEYTQYYTSPHEVFARAYSQWVSEKLGDSRMLSALKAQQDKGFQFTDEEFDRIRPHVEAILKARGLMTE